MEEKSWEQGQPDPHEKPILQRLVYAYITTYRTSEGAQKTPRALPPLLVVAGTVSTGTTGAGAAAGRSAFVGGRWVPAASLDGPRRVRHGSAVTGSLYGRW